MKTALTLLTLLALTGCMKCKSPTEPSERKEHKVLLPQCIDPYVTTSCHWGNPNVACGLNSKLRWDTRENRWVCLPN